MTHVEILLMRKTGYPLLLGGELEKEVKACLIDLCKVGGHINSVVAIAAGKGIVCSNNSRLLAENMTLLYQITFFLNAVACP